MSEILGMMEREIAKAIDDYIKSMQTERYPEFIVIDQILSIRLNGKLEPDPKGRYGIAVVDREAELPMILTDPKDTIVDNVRLAKRKIKEAGFVKEIHEKFEEEWSALLDTLPDCSGAIEFEHNKLKEKYYRQIVQALTPQPDEELREWVAKFVACVVENGELYEYLYGVFPKNLTWEEIIKSLLAKAGLLSGKKKMPLKREINLADVRRVCKHPYPIIKTGLIPNPEEKWLYCPNCKMLIELAPPEES